MQAIETLTEKVVPEIRALRRDIHRHPEPAFEEQATAGKVVEKLERITGIDIQLGVAGTGIVATLGAEKNRKCIALRAVAATLLPREKIHTGYPAMLGAEDCNYSASQPGGPASNLKVTLLLKKRK